MDINTNTNTTINDLNYNNGNGMYQNNQYSSLEEPITIGEWLITYLILCIPLVNFIMIFVWAFGGSAKKSKANLMKALLIASGVIIALYIVLIILFGGLMYSII